MRKQLLANHKEENSLPARLRIDAHMSFFPSFKFRRRRRSRSDGDKHHIVFVVPERHGVSQAGIVLRDYAVQQNVIRLLRPETGRFKLEIAMAYICPW